MKPKTLKILLAVFAVLIVFVFAAKKLNKPPQVPSLAEKGILTKAKYLSLHTDFAKYKFAKSGKNWQMLEPFNYKANTSAINQIVSSLARATISGTITKDEKSLQVYGLDKDKVKVSVTDEKNKVLSKFTIGSQIDFLTFYMYDEDKKAVKEVSGLNAGTLRKSFYDWLNRTVFETKQEDINYISIEKGTEIFKFSKKENEWFLETDNKPEKMPLEKVEKIVKPLLAGLSHFQAEKVIPINGKYSENIDFKKYIKIETGLSNKPYPEVFIISESKEKDKYYLKQTGNQSVIFEISEYRIKPFLIGSIAK